MRKLLIFFVLTLLIGVVGPPACYSLVGIERPELPKAGRSLELRDGTRLNVLESGNAAAHPIVLIHGLPGSGYDWRPLPETLAAGGGRVIAYDRKGYGHSDARGENEAHSMEANASELLQLLEALELRNATLVGWSYGGGVATLASIADSSRIARVVLLASVGPAVEFEGGNWIENLIFSAPVLAWVGRVPPISAATTTALSREAFSEQAMPDWWVPQTRANLARTGTRRAMRLESQQWPTVALEPEKIGRPVLVIHGSEDRSLPLSVGEDLYRRTQPESKILRVSGGSHMLPVTHAELLAQHILSFSGGKDSASD
ncbi:MAG: alpha/beta hydrolase [bacterium]|nr:alpha/beta hydrolase [bacterium]